MPPWARKETICANDVSFQTGMINSPADETLKETSLFESDENAVAATMFQTAGRGSAIAVSAENVARANEILQEITTGVVTKKGGDTAIFRCG